MRVLISRLFLLSPFLCLFLKQPVTCSSSDRFACCHGNKLVFTGLWLEFPLLFLIHFIICIFIWRMLSDFRESCNMCIFVYLLSIISAKTNVWNFLRKNWHPSGFGATVCVNESVLTLCWCAMSLEYVSGTFCCLTQHICLLWTCDRVLSFDWLAD